MNDSGGTRTPPDTRTDEGRIRARIERAIWRARLVLFWETIWPLVAPLVLLAGLFIALSWFGLWRVVPCFHCKRNADAMPQRPPQSSPAVLLTLEPPHFVTHAGGLQ